MWIMPSCISDLSAAATELKRDHPREFGDLGALSQAFGLFVFSYSCGSLAGPTIVGVIKAKADWGAATSVLASACALACVPIVSFTRTLFLSHSAPKTGASGTKSAYKSCLQIFKMSASPRRKSTGLL